VSEDGVQGSVLPINFKWVGGIVDVSIDLEAFRPIVFIGFNNTLKSITARVVCATLSKYKIIESTIPERLWERYLERITKDLSGNVYPEIELTNEIREKIKNMLGIIIEDSRVSMRKYLEIGSSLKVEVENFKEAIRKLVEEAYREDLIQKFDNIVNDMIYGIMLNIAYVYQKLKMRTSLMRFAEYGGLLKTIINEVINEFKDVEGDEIFNENMIPLDVEVESEDQLIKVKDLRTREEISEELVSTSVSSMLLFKLLPVAIAVEKPKMIVIEEPEYALSPLQQVLFARLVENLLIKSHKNNDPPTYMILITHSPYIAVGFNNPKIYYFRYSKQLRKFISEEAWPAKQFALATALLFKISRETS
jgi:predicted ATPase